MANRKKFFPQDVLESGGNSYYLPDQLSVTNWMLSQTTNIHAKAFDKAIANSGTGITVMQWMTLSLLLSSPGSMSLTEIARFLPIEIHSVSALVEKLEARGLIKRIRSRNDRRVVNIYLTDAGLKVLQKVVPFTTAFTMKATESLSKTQLVQLERIMRKIRDKGLEMLGQDPKKSDMVVKRLSDMTAKSKHLPKE
ncbi:MAG: MarR family transcriptional regulator [Dehalococcoidia bacterium]|nr:MAG: MarR family transcriptional regulator [Dehalococcoidia bacterium]